MVKVICKSCDEGCLNEVAGGEDDTLGYMCEFGKVDYRDLSGGTGCNRLVEYGEYRRQLTSMKATSKPSVVTKSTTPVESSSIPSGGSTSSVPSNSSISDVNPSTTVSTNSTVAPARPLVAPVMRQFNHLRGGGIPTKPDTGIKTRSGRTNNNLVFANTGGSKRKSKGSDDENDFEGETDSEDEKIDLNSCEFDDDYDPNANTVTTDPNFNNNSLALKNGYNMSVARVSFLPSLTIVGMEDALKYGKKRFQIPAMDPSVART